MLVYYVPLIRVGSSRCSVVGLHTTPLSLDLAPLCYFTTSTIPTPLPCTSPVFLPTQGIPHRSKTRITTSEHPQALNIAPFILFSLHLPFSSLIPIYLPRCVSSIPRVTHVWAQKAHLENLVIPRFHSSYPPQSSTGNNGVCQWFLVLRPWARSDAISFLVHFITSLSFPFSLFALVFFSFASAQIALTPYFERSLCHYPFIALPLP